MEKVEINLEEYKLLYRIKLWSENNISKKEIDNTIKEYNNKYEKTNKDCPKCNSKLYNETIKVIDYPYVCLDCDENFYNIEI